MTFRSISVMTLLSLLAAFSAFGQTAPSLPSYVAIGAAYNQIGTPNWNAFFTAIYPLASPIGMYTSTTTDLIPVRAQDPKTGRQYWAISTGVRQGVHEQILNVNDKFRVLVGGDLGAAFSQASPSGTNVNLTGSFTGTVGYQFSKRFGVLMPIRGLYVPQVGWNLILQAGIAIRLN